MQLNVLGIRHHGVGSALQTKRQLYALAPDCIIIEGPIEIGELLNEVDVQTLTPPLAILGYNPKVLEQSYYYPFATYSPEWQALLYAKSYDVDFRSADLPLRFSFGLDAKEGHCEENENKNDEDDETSEPSYASADSLDEIAKLDGYASGTLWWEHHFENNHESDAGEYFQTIMNLMQTLRETYPPHPRNDLREAFMREAIREAMKEGKENIVFICGAWHAPALLEHTTKKREDNALMKKLPKRQVICSLIPWMNQRLSWQSGYGAGIASPGWAEHVWRHPKDDGKRWLIHVAKVFRSQGIDVSTAHVIETLYTAHALASIRGLHKIGLDEMNEAVVSVMCMGDEILLNYVKEKLIVGNRIGKIPSKYTTLPIKQDFEAKIKTFRLQIRPDPKEYTIDLRKTSGLNKSIFLHRLNLLNIGWGSLQQVRSKGSFKEVWRLAWKPEIELDIIDKGVWGNSIELAAQNYLVHLAKESHQSVEVCQLIDVALITKLFDKIDFLIHQIEEILVGSTDTLNLIATVVPLIEISRYDDIRQTDLSILDDLIDALMVKISVHLADSCYGLDEDNARNMFDHMKQLNTMMVVYKKEELKEAWLDAIERLIVGDQRISYIIQGAAYRILFDTHRIDDKRLQQAFSQALSYGVEPLASAYWIEGVLGDNAMILIVDHTLWNILYRWLDARSDEEFDALLPILRRTFSYYAVDVRYKIGQKAQKGLVLEEASDHEIEQGETFNVERAKQMVAVMKELLAQ